MINFTHLQAFYEVALAGSISAGAERLHVSQPAVTREIKALEAHLGVVLFDRLPRGVLLTAAGELLQSYAAQIFALARAADADLKELAGLEGGALHISASATVGVYLVPEHLAYFNSRFPNVQVELDVGNTRTVEQALIARDAAVGFIEGPYDDAIFEAHVVGADDIVAVVAPSHPLAGRCVKAQALTEEVMVLRESGSGTRAVVEQAFASIGLTIRPRMSVGSTEAIKRMLANGLAIAYLSSLSVRDELQRGELLALEVDDLHIERPLTMIWLKGRAFSPSAQAFIEIARHTARPDSARSHSRPQKR